jgi:DNA polymerase I-like protein with 3'-5' exonuclease and polymerase domains
MHLYSARDIFPNVRIPDDELKKTHPECREHVKRYHGPRQRAKQGVHSTNYFCQPRTLAKHIGTTVHEAENFQRRWFGAHPGIKRWHERTLSNLIRTRRVTNKFGYSRKFFERPESALTSALAWQPQSTVAIVSLDGLCRVETELPEVELLSQVHDSLVGQFPIEREAFLVPSILHCMEIVVPYPDPLIIPADIHTSSISWGHCK